jgi:hypothetical protein
MIQVAGKWGKPFLSLRVRTLLHASHRLQTDSATGIFTRRSTSSTDSGVRSNLPQAIAHVATLHLFRHVLKRFACII